jgi:uncharacterized membrane protein (UPF0136 family)
MGLTSFARSRNPLPLIGGTILASLYGVAGYRLHRGLQAAEQVAFGNLSFLQEVQTRILIFQNQGHLSRSTSQR